MTGEPSAALSWQSLLTLESKDWESGRALELALEILCGSAQLDGARIRRGDDVVAMTGALADEGVLHRIELSDDVAVELACPHAVSSLDPIFERVVPLALRVSGLSEDLKAQTFQDNYKLVTLEALYDVGLAIASTLNLDELTEEILLRAVSLLDARRGALYLGEGESFQLERTIGGEAVDVALASDSVVADLLVGKPGTPELLPGASYPLAVPIRTEGSVHGLLAVADKESRTGVGPFSDADQRALTLFANQASIALENAHLHRQALEKERLEREMELAAEIQRGILPAAMPQLGSIETVGWNRPTRQVGGDYYGSLSLDDGRQGVVVADVTGKGMPAALLVSTLHSALRLLLDKIDLGTELFARLNQHIVESSSANKFITLILVELTPGESSVGYLNAGHNPGLLVTAAGEVHELRPSGLPLGLLPEGGYRFERADFGDGDLLCLYSDGITECESPSDEEFGLERLAEFLVERRTAPLAEILAQLDQAVVEFAGDQPQGDDQTVVLIRKRS